MKREILIFVAVAGLAACNNGQNNTYSYEEGFDFDSIESDVIGDDSFENDIIESEPIEYDPVVGSYNCDTGDKMAFYSNNTGLFVSSEGGSHDFVWERHGNTVTITYGTLGSDRLTFDAETHTLKLKTSTGFMYFQ